MDKQQLADFLALSKVLTGVEKLDEDLGRQYLDRLSSSSFEPGIKRAIETFRAIQSSSDFQREVEHEIMGDDTLRSIAVQVVLLWYTSALQDNPATPQGAGPLRYGTQEEYFSGVGWEVIGAHVPGLSGGYFGHWRYRPDNEPKGAK